MPNDNKKMAHNIFGWSFTIKNVRFLQVGKMHMLVLPCKSTNRNKQLTN